MCVVRNDQSNAVQTEISDEAMRSVQRVRSLPHPIVYISLIFNNTVFTTRLVVDSFVFMQWMDGATGQDVQILVPTCSV